MPTGYTAVIEDGDPTFREFVWLCARAFGALIEMRDESMDARVPREFAPSDYHEKCAALARDALAKAEAMTLDEAAVAAEADHRAASEKHVESMRITRTTIDRYDRMVAQIEAWTPPTKDHEGLKAFMLDQIAISTEYDREQLSNPRPPEPRTAARYVADEIEAARWSLDYHEKGRRDERVRTTERNAWVAALRESVGEQP